MILFLIHASPITNSTINKNSAKLVCPCLLILFFYISIKKNQKKSENIRNEKEFENLIDKLYLENGSFFKTFLIGLSEIFKYQRNIKSILGVPWNGINENWNIKIEIEEHLILNIRLQRLLLFLFFPSSFNFNLYLPFFEFVEFLIEFRVAESSEDHLGCRLLYFQQLSCRTWLHTFYFYQQTVFKFGLQQAISYLIFVFSVGDTLGSIETLIFLQDFSFWHFLFRFLREYIMIKNVETRFKLFYEIPKVQNSDFKTPSSHIAVEGYFNEFFSNYMSAYLYWQEVEVEKELGKKQKYLMQLLISSRLQCFELVIDSYGIAYKKTTDPILNGIKKVKKSQSLNGQQNQSNEHQ